MIKMNIRKNEGITLIALVTTIIVLLILAGVAISMLSGENGILRKAAEAKTKTEIAQKEEETTLIDYDIEGQFRINNSNYKCREGYITGITYGEDTVDNLNSALNGSGYTVATYIEYDSNNEIVDKEIEDSTMTLRTGMGIKKDGKIVARLIKFGDVNGDGYINYLDSSLIKQFLAGITFDPINIQAMDVNDDGKINMEDANFCLEAAVGIVKINQDKYVTSSQNLIIRDLKQISKEYVENDLPDTFKNQSTYRFEYDKDIDNYVLKGATTDTDASSITDLIPESKVRKGFNLVTGKIESGCTIVIPIDKEGYEQIKFDIVL